MKMERSGTFTKNVPMGEGPYLSLNKNLTADKDLGSEPEPALLEQMKQVDPELSGTWTIWEQHKQSKDGDYSDAMKQVVSFSTAKEFWGCWNHIPQPSQLLEGKKIVREGGGSSRKIIDSIAIFRKGVMPEWEDPQNANGGHFQLTLKPRLPAAIIDELWNNVILGMISDAIEPASMLTGARLVDKLDMKGTKAVLRIELWFNELDDESRSGGQGKVYDLRGSFERCIRMGLDGRDKPVSWGNTDMKPHAAK
mmetsp:Transcript_56694/g.159100  ORF Transcript_56694/g.159100 Transcript_56694/m.159100 type:complete len:252 (-) Transcript_56694:155-910(-)